MASPSHDFSLALEHLEKVQQRIEWVRKQNETTVQRIAELFKKPWPSQSKNASKRETSQHAPASQNPKDSGRERAMKSDDLFSVEEQSVLEEVDSILAQAHKLRHFQEKVRGKQSDKTTKKILPEQSDERPNPIEISALSDQKQTEPVGTDSSGAPSSGPSNDVIEHSDVAVISAKDLDRLLKKDPQTVARKNSSKSRPSSRTQRILDQPRSKTKAQGVATRTKLEVENAKAKRMSSLQFRTSSSEIGKHTSRPPSRFDSTQSRFKRETKGKVFPQDKSKRNAQENMNQNNARHHLPPIDKPHNVSSKPLSNSSRPVSGSSKRTKLKSDQYRDVSQKSVPTSIAADIDTLTDAVSGVKIAAHQEKDASGEEQRTVSQAAPREQLHLDSDSSSNDQRQFMLSKDGGSLTVPPRLKKLRQHNARLREKLRTLMEQEHQDHSHHFMNLMSPECDQHPSEASIVEACERLVLEYHHLMDLTRDLKRRLAALHELSRWEDVYYLHAMCDSIRERYKEMGREVQQLKQEESQVPRLTARRGEEGSAGGSEVYLGKSPFLWNCSGRILELLQLNGGNILRYCSRSDLLQWNRLVYQVQYLEQQKQLQGVLGGAVLGVLGEMDPTHPDFPSVYRLAHGLIINTGSLFPSMISDDDQGDDSLVDDES